MFKPLFQRNLLIIWSFHILMLSSYTFHSALLPLYMKEQGLTEGTVGFILAMVSAGSVLAFLTSGPALDRFDSRWFIAAGALSWVITGLSVAFYPSTPILLICRILQGIGWSIFYTATVIYTTRSVRDDLRGTVVGFIEAIGAAAISVTPALAIWMMQTWNYREAFIASSLLAALVLPLCLLLPRCPQPITPSPFHGEGAGGEVFPSTPTPMRILSRNALIPGLITAALFFCAVAYVNLAPLVGLTLAVGNIGIYMGLRAFGTVPTRLLSGFICDRKGAAWAVIPGYLVSLAALALIPLIRFETGAYILAFMFGLGMGAASPALTTWVINRVPSSERGTALNTIALLSELSGFIGTWIFGITLQSGQLYGFYLLTAIMLLGLVGYLLNIYCKPPEGVVK